MNISTHNSTPQQGLSATNQAPRELEDSKKINPLHPQKGDRESKSPTSFVFHLHQKGDRHTWAEVSHV